MSSSDKVDLWNTDSGMESMSDSNKDITPVSERYDDEEEDETLVERLWGLTEMFPQTLRNHTSNVIGLTRQFITKTYSLSCTTTWCISTTAALLLMPVLFETERVQVEEAQKNHSKQLLLGPGSGSGNLGGGMAVLPN
ncbi:mitochondrial import receptor subunit TOM22 homolog [Daktulosphaira vitifoliae]|uniref:mitochondrial import receptor subunit TOM22 homolog n=1 Tax=Daktulosphaira vitifoliae TaxID=58002 RepID=UPI0021A9F2A3|nr:mitochondrial import receptor subunit TOM22 homolog [Daktulosphaira vitifoliae]